MTEPKKAIEKVDAWQQDESGDVFRILVIEGIQYIQYERDQNNVRRYGDQHPPQNNTEPRYRQTKKDIQRVKSAPEPKAKHIAQHHNVYYATHTGAQYPASTDPRTSQPEKVQTAPFTLFPRENDPGATQAPSSPSHILPQGGPRSHLSEYGQRFIQIPEGDYGSCQEFMASCPGILKENPSDYLKEAVRLQSDGRDSPHVRSCVQQFLLLRKVYEVSEDESQIFLSKMKCRDKTTLSAFTADFGVILNAIKKQAGATQSNLQQPSGPRIDEGLPVSVGRLNLSTLNQQNTVRNHGAGDNGARLPPITHWSSTGRRESLSSVDENSPTTGNQPRTEAASVIGDNYDIPGVGEGREELDHRYYVRPDGAKFFKVGRVFAMLWHEGAGDPKGGHMSNREKFRPVREGKYGESVYSHILRMVVVRERHGYCWCIPIHTYHGRGVLKPGFNRQDQEAHAIIHMEDTKPGSNSREEIRAMTKQPIAVRAASRDQKLDVMSRLNFGSPYSVQMNVKVMNVGKVTGASMPAFESYWRNEESGEWKEELDHRYYVRPDGAEFSKVGRVFATPRSIPQDSRNTPAIIAFASQVFRKWHLKWHLIDFLRREYDERHALNQIMVLCGSEVNAEYITCQEYAHDTQRVGDTVLEALNIALATEIDGLNRTPVGKNRTQVGLAENDLIMVKVELSVKDKHRSTSNSDELAVIIANTTQPSLLDRVRDVLIFLAAALRPSPRKGLSLSQARTRGMIPRIHSLDAMPVAYSK